MGWGCPGVGGPGVVGVGSRGGSLRGGVSKCHSIDRLPKLWLLHFYCHFISSVPSISHLELPRISI